MAYSPSGVLVDRSIPTFQGYICYGPVIDEGSPRGKNVFIGLRSSANACQFSEEQAIEFLQYFRRTLPGYCWQKARVGDTDEWVIGGDKF